MRHHQPGNSDREHDGSERHPGIRDEQGEHAEAPGGKAGEVFLASPGVSGEPLDARGETL